MRAGILPAAISRGSDTGLQGKVGGANAADPRARRRGRRAFRRPIAGQAGMGVAYGGQDAAIRTLLAYQQNEESSADQAAVSFLNATKQSGRGMLETFEFMASKLKGIQGIDPYLQSHPLPQARIASSSRSSLRAPTTKMPIRRNSRPATTSSRRSSMASSMTRDGVQSLSEIRPVARRRLRPGDRNLSPVRRAGRHAAARCADRRPAQLALFPRAQGTVPVRKRQVGAGDRALA